jgi:hypothetical protein
VPAEVRVRHEQRPLDRVVGLVGIDRQHAFGQKIKQICRHALPSLPTRSIGRDESSRT